MGQLHLHNILNGRNGMLYLFFNIFSVQEFSKRLPICFSEVSLTLSSYVKFTDKIFIVCQWGL